MRQRDLINAAVALQSIPQGDYIKQALAQRPLPLIPDVKPVGHGHRIFRHEWAGAVTGEIGPYNADSLMRYIGHVQNLPSIVRRRFSPGVVWGEAEILVQQNPLGALEHGNTTAQKIRQPIGIANRYALGEIPVKLR